MNERIKKLRKALDLTQQKFADKIGVQRNTVAMYEMGKATPSNAVVSLICREFRVNEEWLRDGTGEMFLKHTRDEDIAEFIGQLQETPDDDFKKRLIGILAKLPEDKWEFLAQKAVELVAENEEDQAL